MARRTERLSVDHVADLPGPGTSCLFWELDPVRRDRVTEGCELEEKQAWVTEVLREWGSCGQVARDGETIVGFVLYAPAAFVPGGDGFPTSPISVDAVELTALYVDPDHRGCGWGRLLVRAMARDLVKREVVAIEAFGDSRRRTESCVSPTGFLSAVGFRTHRQHLRYPRMRMDLRSTLTWKEEVEQAIGALLGAVRPVKQPKAARPQVRDGRPLA